MKKSAFAAIFFAITVLLAGCKGSSDLPKALDKEGIAPYELSESEKYILQSFDMDSTSQIISFNAPKEAITLNVNIYRLSDSQQWETTGGGGISIGTDRQPLDHLSGSFTMQLKENYSIDFNINAGGLASYKSADIAARKDIIASTKGFLQEFQEIEINKEIPVAFMVYDSGTKMSSHSLQDFFEPAKFDGMDLVQFVTLEFSDKE